MKLYFLKIKLHSKKGLVPPCIIFPVARPKKSVVKKYVSEMLEKYLSVKTDEGGTRTMRIKSLKGGEGTGEKTDAILWQSYSLPEFLTQLDKWELTGA